MKKIFAIIILVLVSSLALTACGAPAPAQIQDSQSPVRQISITGKGEIKIVPDIAVVNIGVNSNAPSVDLAISDNNIKTSAVKDFLLANGVAPEDIRTSSFNVYPNYQYDIDGSRKAEAFSVDNMVNVVIRDIDEMGRILNGVIDAGANNIYGINFDVSNRDEIQLEVQKLAIEDAKNRAEELAKVAGVKLDGIQSLSVDSQNYYPVPMAYDMKMAGGMAESAVPISAGETSISATAYLSFLIK